MAESKKISEYNFPIELFVVGNKYSRDDINQRLEKGRIDGFKGITEFLNCFALVVTLEKKDKPKNQKYKDLHYLHSLSLQHDRSMCNYLDLSLSPEAYSSRRSLT